MLFRSAIAITPAKTPGPIIAINKRAQISELIERVETIINKAIGLIINLEGVVFLAARNATGTAIINAKKVPSVAIFKVSQIGLPS